MNKELMRTLGFGQEVELVETGKCPFCKITIDHSSFTSELSKREFKISGLCQACQDKTFDPPAEDMCPHCGEQGCPGPTYYPDENQVMC